MEFPARLREARIATGLTQQQVADLMGVTNSTYCGYETGKRQPDVKKLKQLSFVLSISVDKLLDTDCYLHHEATSSTSSTITPDEDRLVGLYRKLNDEGQEKLVDYAEDLVAGGRYIKTDPFGMGKKEA